MEVPVIPILAFGKLFRTEQLITEEYDCVSGSPPPEGSRTLEIEHGKWSFRKRPGNYKPKCSFRMVAMITRSDSQNCSQIVYHLLS